MNVGVKKMNDLNEITQEERKYIYYCVLQNSDGAMCSMYHMQERLDPTMHDMKSVIDTAKQQYGGDWLITNITYLCHMTQSEFNGGDAQAEQA